MANKYRSIAVSTVMSLAIVFTTVSAPTADASGSGSATEGEKKGDIELLDKKPKVAEVPENNNPNRVITNFKGDTKSEMGFSWYTTDKFKDTKV